VAKRGSVHLVGSINLPDAQTVMRTVSGAVGDYLERIPDGEVGERFHWVLFQIERILAAEGIGRVGEKPIELAGFDVRPLRVLEGVDPHTIQLPSLGYADAAISSWETFQRLEEEGVIAGETRFQVSLPTPVGVIGSFVRADDRAALEPIYRDALYREIDRILEVVPADRLAIQWDNAVEFSLIELEHDNQAPAGKKSWFGDLWSGLVERTVENSKRVPERVQMGYHLCYGDVGEKHFIEPRDAANLTRFANEILTNVPRRVDWVHLPVPIERDDEAYFAPLADLKLPEETQLYLGLMHREDLEEGARRRVAAAKPFAPRFGVATECGFGRSPRESTEPLLQAHAAVADELS
jgi:hypothetical protein